MATSTPHYPVQAITFELTRRKTKQEKVRLLNKTQLGMLNLIEASDTIIQKEMADRLNLSFTAISFNIQRLREQNILAKTQQKMVSGLF